MKLPIEPEIRHFRKVLFVLSVVIFVGNSIPIFIDGLTIFVGNPGRLSGVRLISVLYGLSNAAVAFFSAYLIHLLYKLADNPEEAVKKAIRTKKGTK